MRMAPVGLTDRHDPFSLGCELAALTHGHPTGQIAAGALALIVRELVDGADLRASVQTVVERLRSDPAGAETRQALEAALDLAADRQAWPPAPEAVEMLGGGWIAEEALAISVCAALVAGEQAAADAAVSASPSLATLQAAFRDGLRLAVNHGGDSDSTGSITGNLLGTWWGVDALPPEWLAHLEARDVTERLASDFSRCFGPNAEDVDRGDYPPW